MLFKPLATGVNDGGLPSSFSFRTAYALAMLDSKALAQECSGTSERGVIHFSFFFWLVHPLSAIPGSTVARDLVLIVFKIKLVVVGQLELINRDSFTTYCMF